MDSFITSKQPTTTKSMAQHIGRDLHSDRSLPSIHSDRIKPNGMQLAIDFTAPIISTPIIEHRILPQGAYPEPPAAIKAGWDALIPAVIELSFHAQADRLTLLQSVRKTKNLRGTGSRAAKADTFKDDGQMLDGWLYDVLVPIGTLPIENTESCDRFSSAGAERLVTNIDEPYDANISAQSRNEAMMCLEMLCTKVWYERNRELRREQEIRDSVLAALEFMYWECGIPTSLSLLWDEPPPLWHSVYAQVREFNYRQLYAIEQQNLIGALVSRVEQGVRALVERREYFGKRFRRETMRDPRWSRSFSRQVEVIKAKYASAAEE